MAAPRPRWAADCISPTGVAVDGAGDVFIADTFNNRVVEVPAGGGPQTTVVSGLCYPIGVAVDGAGDIFIADNLQQPGGGGSGRWWRPDHGGQRTESADRCGGGWSGRCLHRGFR